MQSGEVAAKPHKQTLGTAQSAEAPDFLKGKFTQTMVTPRLKSLGKRCFPSHKYGLSYESPSHFFSKHSLLCKESYDNPFIKPHSQTKVTSNLLRNSENFKVSEQRFQNDCLLLPKVHRIKNLITNQDSFVQLAEPPIDSNRFQTLYHQIDEFRKKRELFSDFVEKNDVLNVYGPLNMRDRPTEFRITKDYSLDPDRLRIKQAANLKSSSTLQKSKSKITTSILNTQNILLSDMNSTLLSGNYGAITTKSLETNSDFLLSKRLPRQRNKFPSLSSAIGKEVPVDEERFYQRDQTYLNDFQNKIVRDQMKHKIEVGEKKVLGQAYKQLISSYMISSDRPLQGYEEEDPLAIDQFERQLELHRQFHDLS